MVGDGKGARTCPSFEASGKGPPARGSLCGEVEGTAIQGPLRNGRGLPFWRWERRDELGVRGFPPRIFRVGPT